MRLGASQQKHDNFDNMELHNLKTNLGSKHRRKRLGCGESSGHGKTSGRGGKGQSARSGSSIRIGFEGGQMPLIRRIPKRGFNNRRFQTKVQIVNLKALEIFDNDSTVDQIALINRRIIKAGKSEVKLLSKGNFTKKLLIKVQASSEQARNIVEALGGRIELVP